jgi:hypothetical protein
LEWFFANPLPGELPFMRQLAVQTTRGNGFANGNSQGPLPEVLAQAPPTCKTMLNAAEA